MSIFTTNRKYMTVVHIVHKDDTCKRQAKEQHTVYGRPLVLLEVLEVATHCRRRLLMIL